ncbi:hypothetical protein [Streptomyces sp. 1222.5]|uniref:DUF7848 domain-containing protein n=1 Tax=Streptomyces sp. 1222.5 TaxID=1881026 RepID=UPI003D74747E
MAAGVRSFVLPEVGDERIVVDDLPARRWVECVSCPEGEYIDDTKEAEAWSRAHFAQNPAHDRYRVVRQTGWRFKSRAP